MGIKQILGYHCIFSIVLFITSCAHSKNINLATKQPTFWQTEGFGYIIEKHDNSLTFYDVTQNTCVKNSFITKEYDSELIDEIFVISRKDKAELDWHALHPLNVNRIKSLPNHCVFERETAVTPYDIFDVFWWTYAEHYPYSQSKKWDWYKQYPIWHSMLTDRTSNKMLSEIFSNLIDELKDGHASVVDENGEDVVDVKVRFMHYKWRLEQAWKENKDYKYFWPFIRDAYRKLETVIENYYLIDGYSHHFYENFHFGQLKNEVGYFRIDSMYDFTEESNLQSWLDAVDKTMVQLLPLINSQKGLVIDLRTNGGGTDAVSLRLLSYLFVDQTKIGSKAVFYKTKLSKPLNIMVEPSDIGAFTGSIAVLTSQETASAAEIMLMGLAARDDVIFLGEPSNGSFSDILPKQLPNGWNIGLSNQIYYDVNKVDREEVGFAVDEYFSFLNLEKLNQNRDLALEKAIELLADKSD
jgi:hypothetical protein